MNIKQRLLKFFYPALMNITKDESKIISNNNNIQPNEPFYNLQSINNTGAAFPFEKLKGHYVLIVNTASNCGFTNQYEALEEIFKKYNGKLVVLGFPANDFKNQEAGTDDAIAAFCKINFGVTFPLMQKSVVVKNADQNAVFKWLSDPALNGWNLQEPTWNFCKYLINPEGTLTHFFPQTISPSSKEVLKNIL